MKRPKRLTWLRMIQSTRRVGAQIRKEIDWVIHDRLSMAILFLLPIFLFILMGEGTFTFSVFDTSTVYILDLDNTEYSHKYIENFRGDNYDLEIYDNHAYPDIVTLNNCETLIFTPQLDAYIIVPANFTESLLQNSSASIIMVLDGISGSTSMIMKSFSYGNLEYQLNYQVFNQEILYIPEFRPDEEFSFVILALPVLTSMILFACVNMVASQAIIADEPVKRMLLSPAMKQEVVIAKGIVYSILGAALAFVCLSILWIFYDVPFASFINTFAISWIATIFGASFGMLFSSIATSRLQAAQMSLFIFALQFMLVQFLRIQPLVNFLPMEIVRAVFVNVAFHNKTLFSEPGTLMKVIVTNLGAYLLAIAIYKRKKEAI
jgi:hypothetical protein